MAKTRYSYKYNGKIVRNSNNLYKFALVNHHDKVVACSGTEKGALKNVQYALKVAQSNYNYCMRKEPDKAAYYEKEIEQIKTWHVVELEVIEN